VLLAGGSAASLYAKCRSLAPLLGDAPVELLWTVEDCGSGQALLSVAFDSALWPDAGYFAFGIPQDGGMVGGSALIFSIDSASPSGAPSVLKHPFLCARKRAVHVRVSMIHFPIAWRSSP